MEQLNASVFGVVMNIPNQEETVVKWLWMVDWCKKNHHSPYNSYFWNKAHESYCETFKPIS